jgi:DNA-binding FadR family transcriptional regulator
MFRKSPALDSEFLNYLITNCDAGNDRVPSLKMLSKDLKVSIASLREQMEVARVLGVVEVKPKTGIRRVPYKFQPAVRQSLSYAIAEDANNFRQYSDLRSHIEAAYWMQAVKLLTSEDLEYLQTLIDRAKKKLQSQPVQIPHAEHRELHMTIFRHMENPFVIGLLEVYWELYEAVGLAVYTDLSYLEEVWDYHQKMVDSILNKEYDAGYQNMLAHMNMLYRRATPRSPANHNFE